MIRIHFIYFRFGGWEAHSRVLHGGGMVHHADEKPLRVSPFVLLAVRCAPVCTYACMCMYVCPSVRVDLSVFPRGSIVGRSHRQPATRPDGSARVFYYGAHFLYPCYDRYLLARESLWLRGVRRTDVKQLLWCCSIYTTKLIQQFIQSARRDGARMLPR